MKREFLINVIFLLILNLIIKPIYIFGIDARVQNIVGAEEYGVYFVLYNFVFLLQMINDPGLQSYASKTISQNRENVVLLANRIFGLKIVLSIVFTIIAWLVSNLFGYYHETYLFGVIGIFLLGSTITLFRSFISGLGYYRVDSFFSVFDKVLMILLIGYQIWISKEANTFTIHAFIVNQIVAFSTTLVALLAFLYYQKVRIIPSFSKSDLIQGIRNCLPYLPIIFITAFYMKLDSIIIEKVLKNGYFNAGIYAAGYRFVDAISMIGYLFGALLLPMFAVQFSKNESPNELFYSAINVLFLIGISVMFTSIFYHKEMYEFFYEKIVYVKHSYIFKILMFGCIPLLYTFVLGALYQAMGELKILNLVLTFNLLVNFLGNLFFLPKYGIAASAWMSVICESLIFTLLFYFSIRKAMISIDFKVILYKSIMLLLVSICFFTVKHFIKHWMFSLSISLLCTYILAIQFKFINLTSIYNIYKEKVPRN